MKTKTEAKLQLQLSQQHKLPKSWSENASLHYRESILNLYSKFIRFKKIPRERRVSLYEKLATNSEEKNIFHDIYDGGGGGGPHHRKYPLTKIVKICLEIVIL